MLALLRSITRLTGGQNFQQAPLLAKLSLDLRHGLKDPSQVGTRATPALLPALGLLQIVK
jgi:hypothetical protein